MEKIKKILSTMLIVALLVTMSVTPVFTSDNSMFVYGWLMDGASKSYTFILDNKSDVTLSFTEFDEVKKLDGHNYLDALDSLKLESMILMVLLYSKDLVIATNIQISQNYILV